MIKEKILKDGERRPLYHVIWETKDHRLQLDGAMKKDLDEFLKFCTEGLAGREVIDHEVTLHHVHVIVSILPEDSVEHVVKALKLGTGVLLTKYFKRFVEEAYGKDTFVWSTGYYVSTLGAEAEEYLEDMRKQWLKESQEAGSPGSESIEAQPN